MNRNRHAQLGSSGKRDEQLHGLGQRLPLLDIIVQVQGDHEALMTSMYIFVNRAGSGA